MTLQRWPHQIKAVAETLAAIEGGQRRIVLTSPTGGGKSLIMTDLIETWASAGLRVALYSNRKMLTEQTARVLDKAGIDYAVRAAGWTGDDFQPVQLCSIQTEDARVLRGKKHELHRADRVLIDEVHQCTGPVAQAIMGEHLQSGAAVVGVTATPLGLGGLFERLVVAGTTSELRACGALVPCRIYGPDEPDLKEREKSGDVTEKQARSWIMRDGIFGRVLRWFNVLNPTRRPSILFAPGVKESLWFAEQFHQAGITAAHIDGDDVWINGTFQKAGARSRAAVLKGSKDGTICIVCNRFVLREGIDCLDAETEILTADGWKGIGQIKAGDIVYSMNRDTEEMEYDCVKRCVDRQVRPDERMLTIKSQHVDIRVSEGHEFHVKYLDPATKDRSVKWLTMTGREMAERRSDYFLPLAAELVESGEVPLTDDELRLIAWFMTDGGFVDKDRLVISQSKDFHHEIRALLGRLGLDFRERRRTSKSAYANAKPYYEFTIPKGTHTGYYASRGWSKYARFLDKNGSPLLRGMSRWQFSVFWEEMLKGDGANFDKEAAMALRIQTGVLWCNRKSQADLYMELAVTRGFATHCHQSTTKHGVTMYGVRCRDTQWIGSRPSDKRAAKIALSPAIPGERVWCITNENGTIVTRRNGCVSISGNCPWLSHGVLATVFGSLQSYLQSVGRLLRASPGLDAVTLQDHGGNYWRHGSPNADRHWSLSHTASIAAGLREEELRADREKQPTCCPKCRMVLLPRNGWIKCPCGWQAASGKRSRMVVQSDGQLKEMTNDIYRPRRVCAKPDGPALWKQMYFRARSKKWNATFRQAFALFAEENHWGWPDKKWPLMPISLIDEFRRVADVPPERLRS